MRFLSYAVQLLFLYLLLPLPQTSDVATADPIHSIQTAAADTQRVQQLLDKSDKLANGGKYAQAKNYINKAEQLADSLKYKEGMQLVYAGKANIFLLQYRADSAEVLLEEGISQFPEGKNLKNLLSLLGSAYRYQGKNKKAIKTYKRAISLVDSTKDASSIARIKQNIAGVYYNIGNSAMAFHYYQQVLNLAEQSQDSTLLAIVLNNIGDTYNSEEDFKKATYYLQRSIDVSKAIDFKVNELRSLTNMANTKKDAGKLDEALAYYKKATNLFKEVRPNSRPVIIIYNLGNLYGQKGDLNKAEGYFKKSLQYSKEAGIGPGIFHNSMGLGNVATKRNNITEALKWFHRALDTARQLHSNPFKKDAQGKLYEINKQDGNYEAALVNLESLKMITDSLNEQRYKQQLAEYKSKLELGRQNRINKLLSEKAQKQQAALTIEEWLIAAAIIIILLLGMLAFLQYKSTKAKQKSIRLLRKKRDELEDLNEVKNRLFAVLAHDLRNPLNAMQGMLYLLKNEDLSDEDLHMMAGRLEISMHQNVNIMENLLVWARQQLSGIHLNPVDLKIKPAVTKIFSDHLFQASQKGIQLVNEVPGDLEIESDPDLLDLVLRNLVSNGIKFSEAGDRISVSSIPKNGFIEFKVTDTGIGIPEDQQETIFKVDLKSRTGTKNEKGSGLGLNLCKEFIELQGGTLTFESKVGTGTTFCFTLPVISSPVKSKG